MYVGKIVEMADKDRIYEGRCILHPGLLQAIPIPDPHLRREYKELEGELPSPLNLPPGCRFHTRCDQAMGICGNKAPAFVEAGKGHQVACHLTPVPDHEECFSSWFPRSEKPGWIDASWFGERILNMGLSLCRSMLTV